MKHKQPPITICPPAAAQGYYSSPFEDLTRVSDRGYIKQRMAELARIGKLRKDNK